MKVFAAMKIFFELLVFICSPLNILGNWLLYEYDVSYNDLIELNATCYPIDSCQEPRENDYPEIPFEYSCSCHARCSLYGTCCIDSPQRGYFFPVMECRSKDDVFNSFGYYLVSKCPYNTDSNSIWKSLCEDEWNEDDNILKIAPVTSLDTHMTYKNIYCLKCHERFDNFFQWNLRLSGVQQDSNSIEDIEDYVVSYNKASKTWVASSYEKLVSIPVEIDFQFPDGTSVPYPKSCDTSIISDCHDSWSDEYIRDKCRAYTAVRYRGFNKYKNPHCAICNYVSLDDISCRQTVFGGFPFVKEIFPVPFVKGIFPAPVVSGIISTPVVKGIFSFYHFIDLNRDGADKAKKPGNCEENELWDPYDKRCRKKVCALLGYVVRDGRCSRPEGDLSASSQTY